MSTRSGTATAVTTITAGDIRQVMQGVFEETRKVCQAAEQVAVDFDGKQAMIDCSLLALNDVITAIRLQFYVSGELIREYAFEIASQQIEAYGPPPGDVPTGQFPAGSQVRLVVNPNPAISKEIRDGWFSSLGWSDASPLAMPGQATYSRYGTFVSGGYGVERKLLVNPKYDQPVTGPVGSLQKAR